MITVSRHYKCPKTLIEYEHSLTFAGQADDWLIEQYYIDEVRNNPKLEIVWKYSGKELRT